MESTENTKENFSPNFLTFSARQVAEIFGANFLEKKVCRQWILNKIHPKGAFCIACEERLKGKSFCRFWDDKVVTCQKCGKQFTARTGTFLAGSHLSYREFILLAVLLSYGFSNQKIASILCCDPETIRLWRKKFVINE